MTGFVVQGHIFKDYSIVITILLKDRLEIAVRACLGCLHIHVLLSFDDVNV